MHEIYDCEPVASVARCEVISLVDVKTNCVEPLERRQIGDCLRSESWVANVECYLFKVRESLCNDFDNFCTICAFEGSKRNYVGAMRKESPPEYLGACANASDSFHVGESWQDIMTSRRHHQSKDLRKF